MLRPGTEPPIVKPFLFVVAALFTLLTASPRLGRAADAAGEAADPENRSLFGVAGGLFDEKKFSTAAENYRAFLRRFPEDLRAPDAQMMLAESLYQQALLEAGGADAKPEKGFGEVAKEFEAALRRIPKGDLLAESAAFRLGEIQMNLKRYPEAIQSFGRLKTDYPGGILRGEASILEAQALLAQARAPEAAQRLKALVRDQAVYEGEPRLSLTYGKALFDVGDSSGAVVYLDKLTSPIAYLYEGLSLMRLGRPLVAVDKLRHLPRADPDGPYVELSQYLAAESFFVAKDYLAAIQAYGDFVRTYPRSPYRPGALYKIGLCQFERGDYLSARGSFQSVQQLAAKNEFAELSDYMIGESYLKEERYKEAAFAYADVASSYSDALAGNAQFKLGWTLYKQGDVRGAEAALRAMLAQRPSHPLSPAGAALLGNVLARAERYGDAVMAYQQSLDLLGASALPEEEKIDLREASFALLDRASLLGKDYGRLVSGHQYVLKSLKPTANRWRAATLLYTAEGYFRQGLFDEAAAVYRQVLASFPAAPESAFAQDGLAWCLFKKGRYAQDELERRKLEDYKRRSAVAPTETVLVEGLLPEALFVGNEFEQATTKFNQKKYMEALDGYETFEKTHNGHPLASEAALQSGWCYYRLEYYGQAIKKWEATEQTYPGSPAAAKAAWSTADTYFRAGQYDKAVATYQRILQTYTQDPALNYARLRIAQSYYNGRDIAKAIAAFEDLLGQAPSSPEASSVLDFLTQLLYRPESKADAAAALKRIAQTHPGTSLAAQALFRLARSSFEAGDYASASDQLEQLTANLPVGQEFADAQYYLAESYYNLKRYREAALAYDRFTANYPGDERFVGALFHLGASRFQLKDFEDAAKAFSTIQKDHPKTTYAPVALYNSALSYRKLGKWEEAAQALKTYMKEYPDASKNTEPADELTAVYEEQRQFGKAIDEILKQRDALPRDDTKRLDLSYRLAEDYAASGDESKAVAEYQSLARAAAARDPRRLAALAKLGEHYEQRELWNEALGVYQDLAKNAAQPEWAQAARTKAQVIGDKIASSGVKVSTAAPAAPQRRPKARKKGAAAEQTDP